VNYRIVTGNQLKRWLAARGCTFEDCPKHIKVFHRGKGTLLPRHGSKELPTGTVERIKRALGLK
jgi:mRNA interferase HicA